MCRALRCQRISMHKQLVASVMLSSLFQLIEHSVLTLPSLNKQNLTTLAFVQMTQNAVSIKIGLVNLIESVLISIYVHAHQTITIQLRTQRLNAFNVQCVHVTFHRDDGFGAMFRSTTD